MGAPKTRGAIFLIKECGIQLGETTMIDGLSIAKIFGPIFVIIALWEFKDPKAVKAYADSALKNPGLMVFGAFINLVLGFTIITYFNIWGLHFGLLVTLLGWGAILKGFSILFCPDLISKMAKSKTPMAVGALITILWGAGLCYYGYWI